MLRKTIEEYIQCEINEKGLKFSKEELRNAVAGVEYCISEVMVDSVKDAISNVMYDREK